MDVVNTGHALELSGHLDGRSSGVVRAALYDHVRLHPHGHVVIDLSEVESLDATGFRILAACALRLERVGRRVVLRGCSPELRRLIAVSGRRRLFLYQTRGDG